MRNGNFLSAVSRTRSVPKNQRVAARTITVDLFRSLCLVLMQALFCVPAGARNETIESALKYCSAYGRSPSEDESIVCFDGVFEKDLDLQPLYPLKNDGTFVIRSVGGDIITAMMVAEILRQKNATIVIRDYCLSACANAILIASKASYVLANTVLAWHGGISNLDCATHDAAPGLTSKSPAEFREDRRVFERFCAHSELVTNFFKKRGIADGYTNEPQTLYTKKMFNVVVRESGSKRSIFWMWNPKNHGEHFKGRVFYESYPASQSAVDEIVSRFRLPVRVIYDPEEK